MDNVFHLVMTQVLHFEGLRGMMILEFLFITILGAVFSLKIVAFDASSFLSKSLRLQHLGRVSREWLEHGIGRHPD